MLFQLFDNIAAVFSRVLQQLAIKSATLVNCLPMTQTLVNECRSLLPIHDAPLSLVALSWWRRLVAGWKRVVLPPQCL